MVWKDLLSWGSVLASIIGGGIWAWKKIGKPILKFFKEYEALKDKVKKIDDIGDRQEYESKKIDSVIYLSAKPMFVCNEDGLCILANIAVCELFGATEREMKGYGWMNFIHKEDRKAVQIFWETNMRSGAEDMKNTFRIIHGETEEEIEVTYHSIISRNAEKQAIMSVSKVKKSE